jgi:thiamine-phosphate pyrophosphorylase
MEKTMKIDWELYGVTDQDSARGRSDEEVAKALIHGGIDVLQYRAKKVSGREQLATAIRLRALTQAKGLPLIINDRIDLAVACGADGVHLGQEDLPVSAARLMIGQDLIVGISTHTLDQALRAEAEGADYIGFGAIYATPTKAEAQAVGLQALEEVLARVRIPVVAIGGINLDRLEDLAAVGTRCVAVVSALTGAEDVALATRALRQHWGALRSGEKARTLRDQKLKTVKKVSFL